MVSIFHNRAFFVRNYESVHLVKDYIVELRSIFYNSFITKNMLGGIVMEIHWVNGQYREDNRIFDSPFEVYEWTDSLYQDFSNHFLREENVGYASPDVKVIDCLTELIPQWAIYINVVVILHRDVIEVDGKNVYRVWTSYSR